jgi:hypothetical protein
VEKGGGRRMVVKGFLGEGGNVTYSLFSSGEKGLKKKFWELDPILPLAHSPFSVYILGSEHI